MKCTFHSNRCMFACFSNALECCKCARMRFHCANSSGGPGYLRKHREHCWRCKANGRSLNALSLLHYKENDHVTVTITKSASLVAITRYISIMTIYTVGYLQIFNAGHFFSSEHCHWSVKKEVLDAMVFNETTNDFILLSKRCRTQQIYTTELTTEPVFENFGGISRLLYR